MKNLERDVSIAKSIAKLLDIVSSLNMLLTERDYFPSLKPISKFKFFCLVVLYEPHNPMHAYKSHMRAHAC